MGQEVEQFVAERNRALESLDMEWARKMVPQATCDDELMIAMHKARYECTSIPDALRLESQRWLSQRGYTRLGGTDFLPGDALPE